MLVSVENSHLNSWHLWKIVEAPAKTSKAYFWGNDDVTRRPAIPQSNTVNLPPIPRTNFQTNFGLPCRFEISGFQSSCISKTFDKYPKRVYFNVTFNSKK